MLIAFLPYAGREKDEALVFVHKNIRKYAWFIRIFEIASNHNNLLANFGWNDTKMKYITWAYIDRTIWNFEISFHIS